MIKCKTVEHFTHVKTYHGRCFCKNSANLPEHCIVINVDFDKRRIFAINKSQITIYAEIRTAVGERDKLVVRTTVNIGARLSVEISYERRCVPNH